MYGSGGQISLQPTSGGGGWDAWVYDYASGETLSFHNDASTSTPPEGGCNKTYEEYGTYPDGVIDFVHSSTATGWRTHWLLGDHQNSVRQVVDDAGALQYTLDYDAFGNVTGTSPTGERTRFGHHGQEYDSGTGLIFSGAPGTRYRDAHLWLTQDADPLERDGTNKYWFARNDGVTNADNSGLAVGGASRGFSAGFAGGGLMGGLLGAGIGAAQSAVGPGFSFLGLAGAAGQGAGGSYMNLVGQASSEQRGALAGTGLSGSALQQLTLFNAEPHLWSYAAQVGSSGLPSSQDWARYQGSRMAGYNAGSISDPVLATRAGGVAQASLSAAYAIATAPAALTGVGWANTGMALDNMGAGVRTAWTGEYQQTYNARAASNAAQAAGASPETANFFGESLNIIGSAASGSGVARNFGNLSRVSQGRAFEALDALDTFAPGLNPANYSRPSGMFSGIPIILQYSAPQGGTYVLRTLNTGQVVRTGRTGNLITRQQAHRRLFENTLRFEPADLTNSYAVQRGSEEVLHQTYRPILNKISPIRADNPLHDYYMNSYRQFVTVVP